MGLNSYLEYGISFYMTFSSRKVLHALQHFCFPCSRIILGVYVDDMLVVGSMQKEIEADNSTITWYEQAVGSLIYAMTETRFDIAYTAV